MIHSLISIFFFTVSGKPHGFFSAIAQIREYDLIEQWEFLKETLHDVEYLNNEYRITSL